MKECDPREESPLQRSSSPYHLRKPTLPGLLLLPEPDLSDPPPLSLRSNSNSFSRVSIFCSRCWISETSSCQFGKGKTRIIITPIPREQCEGVLYFRIRQTHQNLAWFLTLSRRTFTYLEFGSPRCFVRELIADWLEFLHSTQHIKLDHIELWESFFLQSKRSYS